MQRQSSVYRKLGRLPCVCGSRSAPHQARREWWGTCIASMKHRAGVVDNVEGGDDRFRIGPFIRRAAVADLGVKIDPLTKSPPDVRTAICVCVLGNR